VKGLNVDNWLRVVAQGDQFRFFVNGQQVELCIPESETGLSTYVEACINGTMEPVLTDSAITVGQLGVVAQSFDEDGVLVEFDNVLVYGPEQ
jgi:hypothetical protein